MRGRGKELVETRMSKSSIVVFLGLLLSVGTELAVAAPSTKGKPAAAKAASPKATAKTEAEASTSKPKSGLSQALSDDSKDGEGKPPVFIRSDSLKLDSKGRIFTYYDNVEVTRGDMLITADKVIGYYDDQNQIEKIDCEDNVVITRGDRLKASSNLANYDVKKGVIILTEAPELNDRGNVLNADKVTIYVNEDRSEAEGHVRVKVLKNDGAKDAFSDLKKAEPKASSTPATVAATPPALLGTK